jgi:fluoroquinolone resistance protein
MSDAQVRPFEDNQQYRKRRFTGVTLSGVRLSSIEFEDCTFERCVLTSCTLYRCRFTNCRFIACDLSLVQVPNSLFSVVAFERSKAVGVDWTKAGGTPTAWLMMSFGFTECVLDYSSFFGLSLRTIKLVRCHAQAADFAEADLSGADCSGTDFTESKFLHTNIEKADFTGATGYAIDPTANRVKQARFSLPEAISLLRGFDVVIE